MSSEPNKNIIEIVKFLRWARSEQYAVHGVTVGDCSVTITDLAAQEPNPGMLLPDDEDEPNPPAPPRNIEEKWAQDLGIAMPGVDGEEDYNAEE